MSVHSQRRLVIVEDEPAHTGLLRRAFELVNGLDVVTCLGDGEAAVDYLQDPDTEPPDLLLIDLRLPKKNGLDVVRSIRPDPRYDESLVVVLTTSARIDEVRAALRLGADYYILKPFDIFALGPLLLKALQAGRTPTCFCQEDAFSALNLKFCLSPDCEGRRIHQPVTVTPGPAAH